MRAELKSIGLTEEEINTYLSLLPKTRAKATRIAQELGVARSSAYAWLNNLCIKGLASEVHINNIKHFKATPPELIPQILETRKESINSIIPQLSQIQKQSTKEVSTTSIFKGIEGLKIVMNDILQTNQPYTCLGNLEAYFENEKVFTQNWLRKAEDQELPGRIITSDKEIIILGSNETCKTSRTKFEISTVTYGNKVAYFTWQQPINITLIEDKQIANREKRLFEQFWKVSKEFPPPKT